MFIHNNFLLETEPAQRLYHEFAAGNPIFDYHNHLSPKEIAENRQFADLGEIWLSDDHYKWRAMRANGCDECSCTGNASWKEKYLAWAGTVPHTLGNPLYHWTHLELKRYFDIDQLLNEKTAEAIWEQTTAQLASSEMSVHGILKRFDVRALCTTDDPVDDLIYHRAIADSDLTTAVFPTFRPDCVLQIDDPTSFNDWVDKLSAATDRDISTLANLIDSLKARHDYFHQHGCRLADHSLRRCYAAFPSHIEAAEIFDSVRSGQPPSPHQQDQFKSYLMLQFFEWARERDWTVQLHLGPQRNNNAAAFDRLGRDTGFDSIGDWPQSQSLGSFLSRCEQEFGLPRVVLYNVNPADNFVMATMAGNFQDGTVPGKIQYGSGWWHLDQKQGMEDQLRTLANTGLLSRFIGMLTDSRSFMSFPRHEYFRRVLCNLIGGDMHRGELPNDFELVGAMVRRICFANARDYLSLPTGE